VILEEERSTSARERIFSGGYHSMQGPRIGAFKSSVKGKRSLGREKGLSR